MDSFSSKLLKVHPDTVMTIRKMYNLDKPGDMDKAIDALAEWLKKQQHLTKTEYPREYLERSIIMRKGSLERAKKRIDKLCSLRTIFSKYYEKHDVINDFVGLNQNLYDAILPELTKDHYRIFVVKYISNDLTPESLLKIYRFGVLRLEYLQLHDYCNGYVAVYDLRQISVLSLIATADLMAMHEEILLVLKGYGLRVKQFHLVTSSKAIEVLINFFKPLFGHKMATRIHCHKNIETLYDHLPKENLPSDLGGDLEPLASLSEQWMNLLGRKENVEYFKEISEAVSNEAYRLKETLIGQGLGVAGTFRTLNVD